VLFTQPPMVGIAYDSHRRPHPRESALLVALPLLLSVRRDYLFQVTVTRPGIMANGSNASQGRRLDGPSSSLERTLLPPHEDHPQASSQLLAPLRMPPSAKRPKGVPSHGTP
jgi:hypothetical protein